MMPPNGMPPQGMQPPQPGMTAGQMPIDPAMLAQMLMAQGQGGIPPGGPPGMPPGPPMMGPAGPNGAIGPMQQMPPRY